MMQKPNFSMKFDFKMDLNNKKLRQALAGFMIIVILGLGYAGYAINEANTRAFDVYLGTEKIGTTRNEEDIETIIEFLKADLSNTYKAEIVLDKEVKFEPTHVRESEIVSNTDFNKILKSKVSFLVAAQSLVVDGEEIGLVKTLDDAEMILDKIKEPYIASDDENANIKEVSLLEDVKIVTKEISFNELTTPEELIQTIKDGGEEKKIHTIEVGENFWTIGKIYGLNPYDIEAANPDKDQLKLKPGDEINLVMAKSLITVTTVEEVEYIEDIEFEVIVETNDSMFTNEKKIKVEGQRGKTKIVANEIKHNGVLVEKEVLNEEIIEEPTNQVVIKGTKELPKTAATGVLMMPTRGRLSSGYGSRWGRMHRGIDIAAPTGTAINAADGGTVSFSGYKNSFGYMVEINHGNGLVTRYAHCSKLLVKKGEKVYKGQQIAKVGNTGNSTGPHLHLEVLKNGVHQNPSKYVK